MPRRYTHPLAEVTVFDLERHGGEILNRVAQGESLIVTRDGEAVAEFRPLPRPPLSATMLLKRWQGIPTIDAERFKSDIDGVLDSRP